MYRDGAHRGSSQRHVDGRCCNIRRCGTEFRKTKIEHLGNATPGQKDVGGLDIAMNDLFRMRGFERIGDLDRELNRQAEFNRPSRDAFLQCFTIQQLHRNELLAVGFVNVVDSADIGMIQCGRRSSLALKALDGLDVVGNLTGQEFERHLAPKSQVLGAVDDTHATAPNPFENPVMRDIRSEHERRIVSQEAKRRCDMPRLRPRCLSLSMRLRERRYLQWTKSIITDVWKISTR